MGKSIFLPYALPGGKLRIIFIINNLNLRSLFGLPDKIHIFTIFIYCDLYENPRNKKRNTNMASFVFEILADYTNSGAIIRILYCCRLEKAGHL